MAFGIRRTLTTVVASAMAFCLFGSSVLAEDNGTDTKEENSRVERVTTTTDEVTNTETSSSKFYEKLEDAIINAVNKDTLKLLKDIVESVEVQFELDDGDAATDELNELTIDLNGNTFTAASKEDGGTGSCITVSGETGAVDVDTDSDGVVDGKVAVGATGTLNVENGTLTGATNSAVVLKSDSGELTDVTVDFDNVSFTENAAEGYGAAVNSGHSNEVDFSDCTFTDNVTTKNPDSKNQASGGAVYVGDNGTATVDGCVFTDNKAVGGQGGAIAAKASDITVTDSTFTNNDSNFGGAIYVQNGGTNVSTNRGSDLKITGSTISDNSATYGGGVYAMNSDVSIATSKITDNSAINYGGGVCALKSNVKLDKSKITDNSATYGGGIYNENGAITITGSNIDDNTVNSANGSGAGVFSNGASAVIGMTGSSVSGNTGASFGGGVYNYLGVFTATNSAINGNGAVYGGAICNYAGATTVKGGTVQGNSASFGGGLYNCNSTSAWGKFVMADGTAFYNNTATKAGDDILNWGGKLTLVATGEMGGNLVLDEDGKPITGWYIDGYNGLNDDGTVSLTVRWGGSQADGFYLPYEPVAGDGTILALKAAHGYISEGTTDPDDGDDDVTPDENAPVTGDVTEEIPLGTPDEEIPLGVPTTGDDAVAILAGVAAMLGLIILALFIMKRNRENGR